jgi:hypothetical protein
MEDNAGPGRFRRALSRLTSSHAELEAEELREETRAAGATLICDCDDRQRVQVSGTLRAVTLRPRAGVPVLEAELWDGSGRLALAWLGRRQIIGIEPGRGIVAYGRIAMTGGQRIIFNPRYELRPAGHE